MTVKLVRSAAGHLISIGKLLRVTLNHKSSHEKLSGLKGNDDLLRT